MTLRPPSLSFLQLNSIYMMSESCWLGVSFAL
ncbi:hypothetical protein AB7M49_004235 [Bradyrhizobium elkanii]